ncbi:MAG TPA: 30S ribosomal protein S6 [Ktedonobacterales bacterium]|nr:30S ribosomal protein S6 [Ktedonobacterales bacterium]
MSRDYELGIVLNPEVGDEQARAIVERVTQTIVNHDGQVVRVNAWGRRRLAYPIEHHRDGLYFFFDLILEPQSVVEIEQTLRVNEEIIRHLMKLRDARAVAQQRIQDAQRDAEREAEEAANAARAEAEVAMPAEEAESEEAESEESAPAEASEDETDAAVDESEESADEEPAEV